MKSNHQRSTSITFKLRSIARLAFWGFITMTTSGLSPSVAGSPKQAFTRPIGDFLSRQGTFCAPDGIGGCFLYQAPIPNYIGWTAPAQGNLIAIVDYAGLANTWIQSASGGAVSLGTTAEGTVTERPLADGRSEIQVILHTKNAMTWVGTIGATFPEPIVFGHLGPDLLAGEQAALGESTLQAVFIVTAPGAPLPDLFQILFFPEPGQEVVALSFRARVDGPLRAAFGVPDGTPGRAQVVQTGIFRTPFRGRGVADGYPAELVNLREVGK